MNCLLKTLKLKEVSLILHSYVQKRPQEETFILFLIPQRLYAYTCTSVWWAYSSKKDRSLSGCLLWTSPNWRPMFGSRRLWFLLRPQRRDTFRWSLTWTAAQFHPVTETFQQNQIYGLGRKTSGTQEWTHICPFWETGMTYWSIGRVWNPKKKIHDDSSSHEIARKDRFTKKSLFGIPSKREGLIQPSVTSQPPRLTAFIREVCSVNIRPLDDENATHRTEMMKKKDEKLLKGRNLVEDNILFGWGWGIR